LGTVTAHELVPAAHFGSHHTLHHYIPLPAHAYLHALPTAPIHTRFLPRTAFATTFTAPAHLPLPTLHTMPRTYPLVVTGLTVPYYPHLEHTLHQYIHTCAGHHGSCLQHMPAPDSYIWTVCLLTHFLATTGAHSPGTGCAHLHTGPQPPQFPRPPHTPGPCPTPSYPFPTS